MGFIIVYITHKNLEEAKKIAGHLLGKRLIACANFFPIESAYRWKGKIESVHEVVSIVKTKSENWEKVKEEVARIHPYDVPCIMKIGVEANDKYEKWIEDETK
ncbi:Divalent-cation tolerance protein CutA [uncultured archaeon]|nr:Divalent-cation tolerance protein CutA [uncultured archaeon]